MMSLARRVARLENAARRRPPRGLTDDEKLGVLSECGLVRYDDAGRVIVADNAPVEVVTWLLAHAPALLKASEKSE